MTRRGWLSTGALALALSAWVGRAEAQRGGGGGAQQQTEACKAALDTKEFGKAEAACREALAADPNMYDARRLLITLLIAQGKVAEAHTEAKASTEQGKNNADLAVMQGVAIYEAADKKIGGATWADALPLLERTPQGSPAQAWLGYRYLCKYYVHEQSYSAKSAQACVEFRKSRPDEYKVLDGESLQSQGYAYLVLKDYPSMLKACDDLARMGGNEKEKSIGNICAGQAMALKGDCRGAIPRLEPLVKLKSPQVLKALAGCYLDISPPRAGDAQRIAEQYKVIKPKDPKAYLLLADVYARQKKHLDALRELSQAKQLAPESLEVRLLRAEVLMASKKLVDAASELEEARRMAPDDVAVPTRLAQLYVLQKQPKKAVALLEPLVSVVDKKNAEKPEERAKVRAMLGFAYIGAGRGLEGVGVLEEATKLDAKNAELKQGLLNQLLFLGVEAGQKGKLEDAEKFLVRARQIDGKSVTANRNLGVLYLLRKKAEKALEPLQAWQQATGQRDRDSNLLLARAYLMMGKTNDAIAALTTARDAVLRASKTPGPALAEILVELGPLQLAGGQIEESVKTLEQARLAAEGDDKLRIAASRNLSIAFLARSKMANRTPEQIAGDLEEVVKMDALASNEKAGVTCGLALAHLDLGKAQSALEELEAARKGGGCKFKPPYDKLGAEFWEAYALYREGRTSGLEKAIETFKKLGGKASGKVGQNMKEVLQAAYIRLAVEQYDRGETRKADASLKAAGKVGAKDEGRQRELKHNLAVIELAGGDVSGAKGVLEKMGNNPREASVNLGLILERQGNTKGALDLWRRSGSRLAKVRGWIDVTERFLGTGGGTAGGAP